MERPLGCPRIDTLGESLHCGLLLDYVPPEQVLNACPIETMNIIVLLLPLGQRLLTDKWPCHMEAPLVCTIHGANLIIHIMSLHPFGPLAIPNENIRRCPRMSNRQIQTMLPKLSMATVTLYTHQAYLGLNKISQRMPPMDAMGMLST